MGNTESVNSSFKAHSNYIKIACGKKSPFCLEHYTKLHHRLFRDHLGNFNINDLKKEDLFINNEMIPGIFMMLYNKRYDLYYRRRDELKDYIYEGKTCIDFVTSLIESEFFNEEEKNQYIELRKKMIEDVPDFVPKPPKIPQEELVRIAKENKAKKEVVTIAKKAINDKASIPKLKQAIKEFKTNYPNSYIPMFDEFKNMRIMRDRDYKIKVLEILYPLRDENGNNIAHLSMLEGNVNLLNYLSSLKMSLNLNEVNNDGDTIAHLMYKHDIPGLTKYIRLFGIDRKLKNNDGLTYPDILRNLLNSC